MNTALFVSLRYLFTARKEKFISLISLISVLGIAIGVMALIIVIAVMTGFDQDLKAKIIGNYSDITISSYRGIEEAGYSGLEKKIMSDRRVRAVSPYLQGQALLKDAERLFAVAVRGVDPGSLGKVSGFLGYLKQGRFPEPSEKGVVLGSELAKFLNVGLDSQLTVYSPLGKQYQFRVCGIFNSGMYDYDMNLAFTGIKAAQELLGSGNRLTALAVKLDRLESAARVKAALERDLGAEYNVNTWMDVNRNFLAALQLEKITMFIILTLIILVASFNIISTLIVMVVDKTRDVGILKALGMTSREVKKIFTYAGAMIGGLGIALGAGGGLLVCALLKKYRFIRLPQDIYYLDHLPVAVEIWPDVVMIVGCASAIVMAATLYPAAKAARLEPVEAIRYE